VLPGGALYGAFLGVAIVQQRRAIKSAEVSLAGAAEELRPLPGNARLNSKLTLLIVAVTGTGLLLGYLLTRSERADRRGYLGIAYSPMSAEQANSLGTDHGLVVTEVFRSSPAESAGIRPGDVLIKVDDDLVTSAKWFNSIRSTWRPNQPVTLYLLRQGGGGPREIAIEVSLMPSDRLNQGVDRTP
jgi:hypothetical protein